MKLTLLFRTTRSDGAHSTQDEEATPTPTNVETSTTNAENLTLTIGDSYNTDQLSNKPMDSKLTQIQESPEMINSENQENLDPQENQQTIIPTRNSNYEIPSETHQNPPKQPTSTVRSMSNNTGLSNNSNTGFSASNNSTSGTTSSSGFLVSFIADARGGTTTSERAVGLKFIVPANTLSGPTRLCCRVARLFRKSVMPIESKIKDSNKNNIQSGYNYSSSFNSNFSFTSEKTTKTNRILVPEPATHEGSALACKTLELAPFNKTFLGPIGIEIPHCASLMKGNREVVAYMSDDGDSWHVYQPSSTIEQQFFDESNYEPSADGSKNIFRVVTTKLPKYIELKK